MVEEARERLRGVVYETPLQLNRGLSEKYGAQIYLKREDLQVVRSYKLRGAYTKMATLTSAERKHGVVCASAGNHAQGVAYSCAALGIRGVICMPTATPRQKVDRVKALGNSDVTIELVGDTFDESYAAALKVARQKRMTLVHPFDDPQVIAGQGTVAAEVMEQLGRPDVVVVPIGGGGLASGLGAYFRLRSPSTDIVGVEPAGAAGMYESFKAGKVVTLEKVDTFVDGAAVRRVGDMTFHLARKVVERIIRVPEGAVCATMIDLYQRDGIVAEPAGALAVAALDELFATKKGLKGKTVVCIVSGGNNDISRYPEIIERSLLYKGLKHYFIVEFSQRPGSLRRYLNDVLPSTADITLFEYIKKNNREKGPALVGVELSRTEDLSPLMKRMDSQGIVYQYVSHESPLFRLVM